MLLRQTNEDMVIGVRSETVVTDALVTNNPQHYDPRVTMGRIVVMPERALVNIISKPDRVNTQIPIVDFLSLKLLDEVQVECGDGCEATTETSTREAPEIGVVVVSAGVICKNAVSCNSCPLGIRETL